MKSLRNALVVAAILAGACATTAPANTAAKGVPVGASLPAGTVAVSSPPANGQPGVLTDAKGNRYKVVCRMERPTGSNIAEKVCRPELDESANQQQLQDQLKSQHTPQFKKSN